MIDLTNEMVLQPDAVIERLKGEVEAKEAELARLQKLEAETKPTEPTPLTEQQAQEACMAELVKVADRHGYIILAKLVQVPQTGIYMMFTADWGLQRKQ